MAERFAKSHFCLNAALLIGYGVLGLLWVQKSASEAEKWHLNVC